MSGLLCYLVSLKFVRKVMSEEVEKEVGAVETGDQFPARYLFLVVWSQESLIRPAL